MGSIHPITLQDRRIHARPFTGQGEISVQDPRHIRADYFLRIAPFSSLPFFPLLLPVVVVVVKRRRMTKRTDQALLDNATIGKRQLGLFLFVAWVKSSREMSRDFEEQLINQLILDSSSIDQTAAAVFKAVFAAGRQTEFVRALSAYSSRKDAEIEKTCQLHYEQFAISIDMLLGLRVEAAHLKQLVHTVLQELSYCGELLYDTV